MKVVLFGVALALIVSCDQQSQVAETDAMVGPQLAAAAVAAPTFGRFVGTLTHQQLGKQQLAKLELISVRSEQNTLLLQGILTVHFGDPRSGEYVSYHYDNVRYEPITGVMTFDQPDQPLTITNIKFADGKIQGDVRYSSTNVGKLEVAQSAEVKPALPLIEPLNGEYAGKCEDKDRVLQIQTFRSTGDTHRTNNAFGAYQVSAQIAELHSSLCPPPTKFDPAQACVTGGYTDSSYNFYSGALSLAGGPRSQSCNVEGSSVVCGTCRFTRISKEYAPSASYSWPGTPSAFPAQVTAAQEGLSSIAGNYVGYLYHDYRGVYQRAKINFATFQDSTQPSGSLRLSANASLYFGEFGSDQELGFRFSERSFPLVVSEFVLDRPDADLDARIKITSYGNNQIRGVWYSKLFGRVGEFLLQRDQAPALPAGASVMQKIGGEYVSYDRKLSIATSQGQAPLNSENPFYPLVFNGYTWLLSGAAPRRDITAGSYDYYTGRIGILLEGDNGQIFTGQVDPDGDKLQLKVAVNRYGLLLQAHRPEEFVRKP